MREEIHSSQPPAVTGPPPARSSTETVDAPQQPVESSGERFRRKSHRGRLYFNAFAAAALLVYLVAIAVSNTHRVKVDWVFGTSSPPLVWLVLFAAVLGWLFGVLMAAVLRRRTRAPRPS